MSSMASLICDCGQSFVWLVCERGAFPNVKAGQQRYPVVVRIPLAVTTRFATVAPLHR